MDPYLFRNTTQVFPWIGKPGYNLTTDMADGAIRYMHDLNAVAPDKPFFLYYAPAGSHSPHQPTKEWIDKFKGSTWITTNCTTKEVARGARELGDYIEGKND